MKWHEAHEMKVKKMWRNGGCRRSNGENGNGNG